MTVLGPDAECGKAFVDQMGLVAGLEYLGCVR